MFYLVLTFDISLDKWLTLLRLLSVYEILDLRKIMILGDIA